MNISKNLKVIKQLNKFFLASNKFHASAQKFSLQYYPINDDVFQLTEEQKQVIIYLSVFEFKYLTR